MNQFRQVMKDHQNQVYSFSRHFLGNSDDAADVTQVVMVKLWEHFDKLKKEQVGGWIMRVTRNACIDAYRARKTRLAVHEPESSEGSLFGASVSQSDQLIQQEEIRLGIDQAIKDLDDPQKTIVILREIQGLSYDEISESLQMPLNTVKVYLHRGRQSMRKSLTKSLELAQQ